MAAVILSEYGEFVGGLLALSGVLGSVYMAQRGIKKRIDAEKRLEADRYLRETASAYEYYYNLFQEHLTHYATATNTFRSLAALPTEEYSNNLMDEAVNYCSDAKMPDGERSPFSPELIDYYARLSPAVRSCISSYNGYRLGISAERRDDFAKVFQAAEDRNKTEPEKLELIRVFLRKHYRGMKLLVKLCRAAISELEKSYVNLEIPVLEHWSQSDGHHQLGRGEELEYATRTILDINIDVLDKRFDESGKIDSETKDEDSDTRPAPTDNRSNRSWPFLPGSRKRSDGANPRSKDADLERAKRTWLEARLKPYTAPPA